MADRSIRAGFSILAVALLIAPPVHGQNPGKIRGVIIDAITGAPIAEAAVTVVGSELVALTDAEGAYILAGVPPGLVKVNAQIIGFLPITTPYYSIRPDSTTDVDFRLAPLTVQLDAVEVAGRRNERPGYVVSSRVVTRDQLPARGNILEALSGVVAGVDVQGRRDVTRVKSRGSFNDMLFVVDGTTITPPLSFYIDAADVDCVEVRHGAHAAVEFRRTMIGQTYSGVILIWTRGSSTPRPRNCYDGRGPTG